MSIENGHVYAPVGLYEVAQLLGESNLDVETVCLSESINPYSLIRPAYATYPGFGVEHMEDGIINANLLPSGLDWTYETLKWGYNVPWVANPTDIYKIMNIAWIRSGARGGYLALNHFDGYLHKVVPNLPILSYTIETGKQIAISFKGLTYQQGIINLVNGVAKGNKGGVVAIPEVFKGKTIRLGFTLYVGTPSTSSNRKWFISDVVNPDTLSAITTITAGIAQSNTDYYVIPWVTDGNLTSNDGNGTPIANSRFYSLKYAADYEGYINVKTDWAEVFISGFSLTKEETNRYSFKAVFSNGLPSAQSFTAGKIVLENANAGNISFQNPANITGTVPAKVNGTNGRLEVNGSFGFSPNPLHTGSVSVRLEATWNGKTISSIPMGLDGSGFSGPETAY